MQEFDLVVIGSGPAGYTGSIRAAQLGMKVACIEKSDTLGGTCLNIGCIPSKALLNSSEKYEAALKHFENIGITADVKLDLQKMLANKDKVVLDLTKGIESLFAKNKVTRIKGEAKISSSNIVEVNKEQIKAKNILITTGSSVIEIPNIKIDEEFIVSSTGALKLSKVPENLIVVGGGYIGLELGSVWRRLGAKVTIIEYTPSIVPMLDKEIATQFMKLQQKQGIEFKLNTKVLSAEVKSGKVNLTIEEGGKSSVVTSDVVLMAVGRKAYTQNLGLESVGIITDKQGSIEINDRFQTAISNIYAVGDVVKGAMLAHKAEEEAVAAVEIMAGQAGHVNYHLIPSVIYTYPEVASVGETEEQLKEKGINYKVGKFPFLANSRARAIGSTEGMVKILADSKTDRVLGAHIIGADAGTLIASLTAYMEFGAASEDIARTCHAHPTLSEAIKEAALSVDKRTINM
ncbi:dihydrolipoyl dehydrogenase [Rickettsia conorii subsp. heilongjiangensis]|uniref:Dihydrolipoyl dehydrogenase n=2 Tax=spotted fever group TaxID=114277 RepID=A0AAD1GII0_RICCR|nr:MULTISPECIES: dihydrolipoyl dehydrogenase [spotted fever group]AEK74755.1 dihydrolipoamide dehydrogenase [Rickettsia conorii subsp. heilongjiangensis 054]KJW04231.1 dihydrolipoyl dehydrogenase [Rickettsia argasii T170-B]UZW38139.1 dihydrolipoyl dehydrogenase [Rickettsia conorii subsp. heilongjiangensis]BBM91509.1 dihydrolipoyl dehydrogenase [Rickettsia conorii subsp. heilongjiangensis]BBM92718.1 dihydrolipoyl dehydrogenase [Rickettsia conorii subsp. heilongjiangensis]